jgi:hypothetical protein
MDKCPVCNLNEHAVSHGSCGNPACPARVRFAVTDIADVNKASPSEADVIMSNTNHHFELKDQ